MDKILELLKGGSICVPKIFFTHYKNLEIPDFLPLSNCSYTRKYILRCHFSPIPVSLLPESYG